MADGNAKELLRLSDGRFSKKHMLDSLWQTLAEEVYPERATFTKSRIDGDEYADDLYTSLPAQMRRDLAYAIGALTRPKNQVWFEPKAQEEERNTERAKAWFSMARDKQRALLYSRRANFQTAMQTSDNDVITFGNGVVRHHEARDRSGVMVYTCEHPVNCAWAENAYREVDEMHRKFKLALRNWEQEFPNKPIPEAYKTIREKDPHHEIELRHIVMPADRYGYEPYAKKRKRHPFVSIYFDPTLCETLREGGFWEFPYTVRRWFLVDGSPYAYSPAAMLGLIESRLLQSQERVIIDAGERAVDPPTVAVRDAVLGNVMNYAGGQTWIDYDYDQRTGSPVQVLDSKANLPLGLEMKQDTREILAACWFINKLTIPDSKDMTAFEVNERISEYIRSVGPAVEPFEVHNALLLDASFSFNLRIGNFGPLEAIPPELQGADVVFEFDGPIQLAYQRQKLQKAKETLASAVEAMSVDPQIRDNYRFDKIARDAASYIGAEPDWLVPEDEVEALRAMRAKAAEQQQAMEMAATMGGAIDAAAETVPKLAAANQSLPALMDGGQSGGAEVMPPEQSGQAVDYRSLFAEAEDIDPIEDEEFDAPAPAPSPRRGRATRSAPAQGDDSSALQDLLKALTAPVEVKRDKSGRVTGWQRRAD